MSAPRVILIAGPTASGKSVLAVALAERFAGTVINADSMQVYRELRVVTARPSAAEEASVPHRLFGTVPGATAYSTGQWLVAATREIASTLAAGRAAIVVGGTGLYFKALTEGLAPIPDIPFDVRSRWRQEAAEHSPADLYAMLRLRDPLTALQIEPTDPQRIVRALEVFEATGRPLAALQAETSGPAHPALAGAMRIALVPDRPWLAVRILGRTKQMLAGGGIEEVRTLRQLGLASSLPVMKAIGVAEIAALIEGRSTPAETEAAIFASTHRYAKRQMTWSRGQMTAWTAIDPSTPHLVEAAIALSTRPT